MTMIIDRADMKLPPWSRIKVSIYFVMSYKRPCPSGRKTIVVYGSDSR